MESFLDENPDFFQDYLIRYSACLPACSLCTITYSTIRKAPRKMIDSWLVAHSLPPGQHHAFSPHDGPDSPASPMSRYLHPLHFQLNLLALHCTCVIVVSTELPEGAPGCSGPCPPAAVAPARPPGPPPPSARSPPRSSRRAG